MRALIVELCLELRFKRLGAHVKHRIHYCEEYNDEHNHEPQRYLVIRDGRDARSVTWRGREGLGSVSKTRGKSWEVPQCVISKYALMAI